MLLKEKMRDGWTGRHHPFGPYATTSGVSRVFVDMVTRNAVLSRLDQALKKIHKSIADVDRFAKVRTCKACPLCSALSALLRFVP